MYTYFLFSVLSEQYLDATLRHPRNEADLVVPAFALLELVMYLGLLKVAETLINPFGVDDNSFDFLKFTRDARLVRGAVLVLDASDACLSQESVMLFLLLSS